MPLQEWQWPELPFTLVDKAGHVQRAGRAALALLPRANATVLIVAARDVLLLAATVPPLKGPKLRRRCQHRRGSADPGSARLPYRARSGRAARRAPRAGRRRSRVVPHDLRRVHGGRPPAPERGARDPLPAGAASPRAGRQRSRCRRGCCRRRRGAPPVRRRWPRCSALRHRSNRCSSMPARCRLRPVRRASNSRSRSANFARRFACCRHTGCAGRRRRRRTVRELGEPGAEPPGIVGRTDGGPLLPGAAPLSFDAFARLTEVRPVPVRIRIAAVALPRDGEAPARSLALVARRSAWR